jgi:pilus assembly protein CpaB
MNGRFPFRTLVFAGLAVALAGGTLFVGQGMMRSDSMTGKAAAIPANTILVAVRPLTVGSTIVAGDLAWRPWPAAGIDAAYIVSDRATIASFTGHVVRSAMHAGEPVTLDRVPAPGARGALALVTRPGLRAVSVALTPTTGVSGLIMPGDHVDVVLTYVVPRPADAVSGNDRRAATTILTDLRVLAIDQRLAVTPGDVKDIHNASLEVSAKQSETLALAADLGKLSLSLRSLQQGDSDDKGSVPEPTGGSTLDYQVGPMLQRAAAPAAVRRAAVAHGPVPINEFHGGKTDASGAAQ